MSTWVWRTSAPGGLYVEYPDHFHACDRDTARMACSSDLVMEYSIEEPGEDSARCPNCLKVT